MFLCTVECRYNATQYTIMFHTVDQAEYKPDSKISKDTQYLPL